MNTESTVPGGCSQSIVWDVVEIQSRGREETLVRTGVSLGPHYTMGTGSFVRTSKVKTDTWDFVGLLNQGRGELMAIPVMTDGFLSGSLDRPSNGPLSSFGVVRHVDHYPRNRRLEVGLWSG